MRKKKERKIRKLDVKKDLSIYSDWVVVGWKGVEWWGSLVESLGYTPYSLLDY